MYYTYLIGWKQQNKWYYGVRYGRKANPEELWKTYFTSSKYVDEFRQIHGEPDIIEIRKSFSDKEKAREWEHKVLKRLNVIKQEKWLNKTTNRCFDPKIMHFHGKKLIGDKNPFYGKKHTKEYKEHSRKQKKEFYNDIKNREFISLLTKQGMKKYKEKFSKEEWKIRYDNIAKKNSFAKKGKQIPWSKGLKMKKSPCKHCGLMCSPATLSRWHNDNCKGILK